LVGDEQLGFVDVHKHKCATPLSLFAQIENEATAETLAEMLPGIGIFGTGSVVRIIVPFLRSKGFVVEALWGRTLPAAQQAAKELGIPFCTTKVDEVLLRKDVDLIFVLCSPHLHAQISVKALGIGKHVLCDRPAGICQNDALKMVKASQYYPSLISIGMSIVYDPHQLLF
jgi:predicted dehydrogenase